MLDEFLGGVREERNVSIGLRGGETTRLLGCCRLTQCPCESKVNTFPRSERVKMSPRSIDTLEVPFPAVSVLESCDFADEKCGCFRGPKTDVHFAEKY